MKNILKIGFVALATMTIVSLTSCSVEYRERHRDYDRDREEHHDGMTKPVVPPDNSATVQSAGHVS